MRRLILAVTCCVAAATADAYEVWGQDFLQNEAIEDALTGNTMEFPDFRTGAPVRIFIARDGRFKSHFKGKFSDGKWWIKEDEIFCRQYSGRQRERCARVTVDGERLTFYSTRDGKPFEAKLMIGNQLPQ